MASAAIDIKSRKLEEKIWLDDIGESLAELVNQMPDPTELGNGGAKAVLLFAPQAEDFLPEGKSAEEIIVDSQKH